MPSDNASQKNSEQNYISYEEYLQKVKTGILTDSGNCPVTPLLKMLQGNGKPRFSMNSASMTPYGSAF